MSAHPFPCCRTTIVRLLALCALLIAEQAVATPVVSNLSAAQRAGTKLVDIQYDLVATGFATIAVSSFYMQRTKTTKAQWDEVRTLGLSNGYTNLPTGGGKAVNHPEQTVTWWDVVKWCNARSEKILSWGMPTISREKRNSLNGGGKAYSIGTSGHHPSGCAESVSKAMGMSFRKRSVPNPTPQASKIFPAAPKP